VPAWAYRLAGACAGWHLTIAPLLVFVIGSSVVVLTWVIFASYHPEYMARTLPSISRTAASPPGDLLFTLGISFVAACSTRTASPCWTAHAPDTGCAS
jgi:hypothetical protein